MADAEPKEEVDENDEDDSRSHPRWYGLFRDAILLLLGVGTLFNEIFLLSAPRWEILLVAASLIGAPGSTLATRLLEGRGK